MIVFWKKKQRGTQKTKYENSSNGGGQEEEIIFTFRHMESRERRVFYGLPFKEAELDALRYN